MADDVVSCNEVDVAYHHLVQIRQDQAVLIDFAISSIDTDVASGTLVSDAGGYLYTPNTGFKGVDSFTYLDANGDARIVRIEVGLLVNGGGYKAAGSSTHSKSMVTALSNGQYILSYIESQAVHYKRYSASHTPLTSNQILYYTNRAHYDMLGIANGGYVTTLANNAKILVRQFNNADGMTRYEEIDNAYEPTLALLANGYYLIGYRSGSWKVHVYDTNSNSVATKTLFGGATSYSDVKVHAMADGGFMAVGISSNQVMMQRYDNLGEPTSAILPVSTTATNGVNVEMHPVDVLELAGGNFVVSWPSTAAQDGAGVAAMARLFTADGAPLSNEIVLNQYTQNDQYWIELAPRPAGGFVAMYQSRGADSDDGFAIMAREFGPIGVALSDEFRVSGEHEMNQHYPSFAKLTDGQLVVGLVDGSAGSDKAAATVLALPTDGADILYGDGTNNIIRGGGGDNRIYGNGGEDLIYDALRAEGGDGHDKFWRSVNVFGGNGNDEVYISNDDNIIDGGAGFDVVYFTGSSTDYTVGFDFNGVFTYIDNRYGSPDGTNTLTNVEAAQFTDKRELVDIDVYAPKSFPQDLLVKVAIDQSITINTVQSVLSGPANGSVVFDGANFIYTPTSGFQGIDSFTYLDANNIERTARIEVGLITNGGGYSAGGAAHTKSQVTALSNGQYILSYIEAQAVHYKRYSASHAPLTSNKILYYTNRAHYDILGLDNGGYVTALANNSLILVREFNSSDTQIRYEEIDNAYEPTLAYLQNGYHVLGYRNGAWYARIYDHDRDYVATKALFAGAASYGDVKIHAMQDGGFIAVGISGNHVMMQRYSHLGEPLGDIKQVSTTPTDVVSNEMRPVDVFEYVNGDYVVSWPSTAAQDGSGIAAMARVFAADGTVKSAEIVLNEYADNDQHWVKLAKREAGGFVAIYQSNGVDGDYYGLMAREFNENGQALGIEFRVSGEHAYNQHYPSVTQLTDGQIVVGFVNGSTGSDKAAVTLLSLPTSGADLIYGDNLNNILRGGAGSDTIYGYGGEDLIYDAVYAYGGDGKDRIWGSLIVFAGSGDDEIYASAGSNSIDGGSGFDIAYFSGAFADYAISRNPNGAFVVRDLRAGTPDGTNYLNNVEAAQFTDRREVLDLGAVYTPTDHSYDAVVRIAADSSANIADMQTLAIAPSHGTVAYDNSAGAYVYSPNSGFKGVDSFTYLDIFGNEHTVRVEVHLPSGGAGYTVNTRYTNSKTKVTPLDNGEYVLSYIESQAVHYKRYNAGHTALSANKILYYTNRAHYDILGLDNGGYVTALANNALILIREFNNADTQIRYEEIDNAYEPTLARLTNGYHVLGYRSSSWYARVYDADRDHVGTKVLFAGNSFMDVKVYAMNDGGFIAVGIDNGDVMMQRYDHAGEALGAILPVSTLYTGVINDEMRPVTVLELPSGDYVVGWHSTAGQDGSGTSAMARVFAADGTAKTAEIVLNQYTSGDQRAVNLAPRANGGFVAVYQSNGADGNGIAIMAREFDVLGQALGNEFSAWNATAGNQHYPSVGQLIDGQLVLGLIDGSSGIEKAAYTVLALPSDVVIGL